MKKYSLQFLNPILEVKYIKEKAEKRSKLFNKTLLLPVFYCIFYAIIYLILLITTKQSTADGESTWLIIWFPTFLVIFIIELLLIKLKLTKFMGILLIISIMIGSSHRPSLRNDASF